MRTAFFTMLFSNGATCFYFAIDFFLSLLFLPLLRSTLLTRILCFCLAARNARRYHGRANF
jgi:hypothetical protein